MVALVYTDFACVYGHYYGLSWDALYSIRQRFLYFKLFRCSHTRYAYDKKPMTIKRVSALLPLQLSCEYL